MPICAILNFMGPVMASLKIQYTTYDRSSIETIAFFVRVLPTEDFEMNERTDGQTDGQAHRVKPLSRYHERAAA